MRTRNALRRLALVPGAVMLFYAAAASAQAGHQYVYSNDGSLDAMQYENSQPVASLPANRQYQGAYPAANSASDYTNRQYQTAYPAASYTYSASAGPAPYYPPVPSSAAYAAPQPSPPPQAPPAPVPSSYVAPASAAAPDPPPASPSPQYGTAPAGSGTGGLSSYTYTYDPNMDPGKPPPTRAPRQNQSSATPPEYHPYLALDTRSGIDVGAQLMYYQYSEPSLSVTEDGPLLAFNVLGTLALGKGFFTTADVRYSFGDVDYSGSGTLNDEGVDSWELRALFGKDFIFQQYSLSPYIGVGYRTLFNDNRGITSDGSVGYRRYNQLYYLPIGVYPRTHIDSNARLTSMLEYDIVLHGLQTSYLSDGNEGDPNVRNIQSSGYGIRGNIMYETRTWAIGPYFNYWSIDQSTTKIFFSPNATCGGNICAGDEPANSTLEAGVQFKWHFF